MHSLFSAVGAITMPTAPKVDLSAGIQWIVDFATSIFTDNALIIIGAGLAISALFAAPAIAKRFGKSAMKG
ncbi:hypothetical protein [Enterococcus termitis]|uniref:Uncharacterized protein n=1 Tax=Enterococcus termitis TaxID=332950 RepID=A0A1E5G800_9ENTE|nr:hypothetical protein [Enterococcus termitis]OEG08826.1 hypothetical protein BCR25_12905 [Enterococcus termitis]OEG08836.1 hypothetical protein BCR25_12955 [Enterococcus termitis]OJG94023.1 hypothetical protein RV18_GL003420 [Enterococcus termitis]